MKYALIILAIAAFFWNVLSTPPEPPRVQVIQNLEHYYEAIPHDEFAEWWGE